MKKQQKKAFTLVELLVVIAILAILASVAVVGYTAFIKNAAVSNDENVVAQMNRYLEALKADTNSRFHTELVSENNIAELLAELVDAGLEELAPHAEKYGYHYYFNMDEEVQRFELHDNKEESVLDVKVARHFSLRANAADEGYNSLSPYAAFTKTGYLFADLGGDWAELVKSFYTVTKQADLKALKDAASNMTIGNQTVTGLEALVDATVFVTETGNHVVDATAEHKNVVVQPEATKDKDGNKNDYTISDVKTDLSGNTATIGEKDNEGNVTTHLFTPDEQGHVIEIPEDVTYVAPNFITVDTSTKVEVGGVEVEVTVTVTIKQEKSEDIAEILESTVVVSTGVTLQNASGATVTIENSQVIIGEDKADIQDKNKVTKFTLAMDAKEGKSKVVDKVTYIAWDGGTFTFKVSDFAGDLKNQTVVNDNVTWSVSAKDKNNTSYSNYVKIEQNEKDRHSATLTLLANNGLAPEIDEITVTATANCPSEAEGATPTQTFTVKVVRVTGVTELKLADKNWADKMTLINSGDSAVDYAISKKGFTYNQSVATDLCDTSFAWSYTGEGTTAKTGTTSISAKGAGNGTLTLKVGSYLSKSTALTVANTKAFPIQVKNNNITVVGNGSPVLLSDLFVKKDAIPAGAEFVVFASGTYTGDTYMNPVRTQLQATSDTSKGLSVDKPTQTITSDNFNTLSVQFTGTDANEIRIAIMQNGIRISEDVIVKVVDGYNVRNYADFTSKVNTENTAYPLTSNVVFLNNITMSGDVNFLQIPADKTLYGNGFKFDITKGRLQEEGIINLKGTLRDVMVVGAVYSTFAFSAGDDYGSSAVNATGNAYIYNSYIANTRSPLRTSGAGVVIEDSVLFGGRYSNIDMTGGTITIKGTVTTVQQVYNDVIGIGVSAWFNDSKKNVNIEEGASFVQYNFMDQSISSKLPNLNLYSVIDVMDLKEPFNAMFADTATYGKYMFTANNGSVYVNSGVVSTDKYSLDYAVTGDATGTLSKEYKVGAIKTVKVETAVGDEEEFIVAYDTRFTPKVGTVISAGYVKVTGAQLKAGVEFEVNTKISAGLLGASDPTPYLFQIQSDDYLTINVTGTGSTGKYSLLTYNFDKDLSSTMGSSAVSAVVKMHDKGIHYGKMCIGVNTPVQTSKAYGTTTYQQLLEQYIEMTDGDGTKDNFYAPENFRFVNGSVSNYWD